MRNLGYQNLHGLCPLSAQEQLHASDPAGYNTKTGLRTASWHIDIHVNVSIASLAKIAAGRLPRRSSRGHHRSEQIETSHDRQLPSQPAESDLKAFPVDCEVRILEVLDGSLQQRHGCLSLRVGAVLWCHLS